MYIYMQSTDSIEKLETFDVIYIYIYILYIYICN